MPIALLSPSSRAVPSKKNARLFRKEVIRQGVYQHPVEPWDEPLDLSSPEAMLELAQASNDAIAAGTKVWVPDGHTFDAKTNTGWVRHFSVGPSEEDPDLLSIYADPCEIVDAKYARKIGKAIQDVSVYIDDYGNEKGESWGPRIVHVALCPNPVFTGQTNFVALAAGGGSVIPVLRLSAEKNMKRTRLLSGQSLGSIAAPKIVRRGLSINGKVRKALAALGVKTNAKRMDRDLLDEVLDAVATMRANPAVDVKKSLSVDGNDSTVKELLAARGETAAAKVTALLTTGRITAGMKEDLTRLLSVRHAFALSAAGAAEDVAVADLVHKVLSALPEDACVPLKDRITKHGIAASAGRAPDAPAEFDSKSEVDRRLTALGHKKS